MTDVTDRLKLLIRIESEIHIAKAAEKICRMLEFVAKRYEGEGRVALESAASFIRQTNDMYAPAHPEHPNNVLRMVVRRDVKPTRFPRSPGFTKETCYRGGRVPSTNIAERNEQIVADVEAGVPRRELAVKYRISMTSIHAIVHKVRKARREQQLSVSEPVS
jgi:hypothetical protein